MHPKRHTTKASAARNRPAREPANRPPVDDERPKGILGMFDRFAGAVTRWAGSPVAFGLAVLVIIAWAVTGPVFGFSETWQLIVNTGTTIVTFLMVFLIQQSQNKDSRAVHLKLDELISAMKGANDELVDIEDLSEEQLKKIADFYADIAHRKRHSNQEG